MAMTMEQLVGVDLEQASADAAAEVPDIVAALDRIMPEVVSGEVRSVIRRYALYTDEAVRALTSLPTLTPTAFPPAAVLQQLLHGETARLPWAAPSLDGRGAVAFLVDRLRGATAGLPIQYGQVRSDVDVGQFNWFIKSLAEVQYELERAVPLRRAMTTLDLSTTDVGELMGVKRQAVDKWLLAGPPPDRLEKIGALAELADLLRYRLRDGMAPIVVRRAFDDGRTMLELVADNDHLELVQRVRESFDYSTVA